jgi:hypothetical protein
LAMGDRGVRGCAHREARAREERREVRPALGVEHNPSWASCIREQQPAMRGGGQASWGWPTALGLDALDTEREQEEAEAELGTGARHGREQSELRQEIGELGDGAEGAAQQPGELGKTLAGRTMADRNNEAARRA